MNFDITPIITLISGINPAAAAIVAGVVFVVQHIAIKQGSNFTLGGLLGVISGLFGGKAAATPAAPAAPAVAPDASSAPAAPVAPSADPLANRPILAAGRDFLVNLFGQKVTGALGASGDHVAAFGLFQKISAAMDEGPFVGVGPSVKADGSVK